MNFKQLNESFESFGITEDADEFNDLNNDYNLPIKDLEKFEKIYITEDSIKEYIDELVDELAPDATIISPATPDVPYLSNGDPGYPGEPAEIEIPDFDYSNFYDIILQEWIYNVLNSGLVDKDKILNDAKRYELILKEIFDEYVKPDKNTLYELIEDIAYKLYADGYFD